MIGTKEFLKSRNIPNIGFIPISLEDYINESNNLTQEKLRTSCFHNCYHLYKSNLNTGITSYITSIPNLRLYYQNLESPINIYRLEG